MDEMKETVAEIRETIAEARGTWKAGFVFIGAMNVLLMPAIVWLFSSTLETREVNISQSVKIEKLESSFENCNTTSEIPKKNKLTSNELSARKEEFVISSR